MWDTFVGTWVRNGAVVGIRDKDSDGTAIASAVNRGRGITLQGDAIETLDVHILMTGTGDQNHGWAVVP